MADVSHELDSLRYVVESPLSSKVAMFNNQAQQHKDAQLLNPFASSNGRVSPKPIFSKAEYGKPLAGSLTEMRGQKANMHVLREMLELCQIISSEGYAVNDEPNMRVIPFGELFNIYNYISDKVVGILLRARKHKLVDFEGEMLFQRRDDDVPVFLLRPILEIRRELEAKIEDIKRSTSPAPLATSLLLHKEAHQQKLQEAGLDVSRLKSISRTSTPASSKASSPAPEAAKPATVAPEAILKETALPASLKTATPTIPEIKEPTADVAADKQEDTKANAAAPEGEATAETAAATTTESQSMKQLAAQAIEPILGEAVNNKIDVNNNDDNATTTAPTNDNELPIIVIEASAVYVLGSGDAPTTDNVVQQEQQQQDTTAVSDNVVN